MPIQSNAMVCIQRASYASLGLESLLQPLGGLGSFVKRGDRVLLKVNLLRASTPEQVVVTDPRLVRAVAQAVLKAGGTPFIADSPVRPVLAACADESVPEGRIIRGQQRTWASS